MEYYMCENLIEKREEKINKNQGLLYNFRNNV